MKFTKIKSYAKINLSLNIIKKLKSNYHKIESLITFVDLHDIIYIRQIKLKNHKVLFKGKFSNKIGTTNTWRRINECLKFNKFFLQKKDN